ncbi:MAG: hypothetical protein GKR93_04705 [Gammaproteobacteria bacterium]|nr:hypothetical protein [Gammaproteobacteria bacterium]
MNSNDFFKIRLINDWQLFWNITVLISLVMLVAIAQVDNWDGPTASSLIQLSVRLAVPCLYLAFAASSLQLIFPSAFSSWLLRNRSKIGLCFAVAMAWQLIFILLLVTVFRDYYTDEVYVLRDAIEGVTGYFFLIAMTLTSFEFVRKHISVKTWRLLHKSGIYYLWAYAFSVYWWELFYYPDPEPLDYIYYFAGFMAWALRVRAWRSKSRRQDHGESQQSMLQLSLQLLAYGVLALGVLASFTGSVWRESAETSLTGYVLTGFPETYLPYWPFEPFLPLLVITIGFYLIRRSYSA